MGNKVSYCCYDQRMNRIFLIVYIFVIMYSVILRYFNNINVMQNRFPQFGSLGEADDYYVNLTNPETCFL